MNLGFPDNFRYKFIFLCLKYISCFLFFFLTIFRSSLRFLFFTLSEQIMTNTSLLVQNSANNDVFVILISMLKLKNKRCIFSNMCGIVVIILDLFHLWLKLANVNACGTNVFMHVVGQLGQIIIQIFTLVKFGPETAVFLFVLLLGCFLFFGFLLCLALVFFTLFFQIQDLFLV